MVEHKAENFGAISSILIWDTLLLNIKNTFYKNIIINYLLTFNNKLNIKSFKNSKNINIKLLTNNLIYNNMMPLFKLSSLFFKTNLVDMLSYQNYNFNNLILLNIFFLNKINIYINLFSFNIFYFLNNNLFKNINKYYKTIEFFFYNSKWAEREIFEMTGLFFFNKIDSRNLLLIYNENIKPLIKKIPSIGYWEFYYNISLNNIIKNVI